MAGGDHGNRRHETAELKRRIVELKDEGLSFREVAAEVDRDLHTVWRHYQNAMREIPAAAVEEHQKNVARRLDEQLRRIDMERESVMDVLAKGKRTVITPAGKVIPDVEDDQALLAAVDRLVKLDDQEAKLLGLYPKQAVSISRETSEVDVAVIGLIQRAQDRANALRARIDDSGGQQE